MITKRTITALLLALCVSCAHAAAPAGKVILVLGDSISAGYGLPAGTGWVTLLQNRLTAAHYSYSAVNASISGDTTAGGRARLDALLAQHHPAIIIIELGGNDGLRGTNVDAMRGNLDAMIGAAQKAGSKVLLVGMRMPPNYGPVYTHDFEQAYVIVAKQQKIALLPFLLAPIAGQREAFQADRAHPVAAAQPKMLDTVWRELKPMLDTATKTP